jgi:hypothetical protein
MEIYFIFAGMLCFAIFGNLGIHLYYKRKHENFLRTLKGKNYTLFQKLDMEMESSTKLSFSYQFNKTDVIILDNEIFLLIFTKPFKQAQPILQISNSNEIFPFVSRKIPFDSKFRVNGKLRIMGSFGSDIANGKYKIFIDFNKTDFDLNSIL